MSIISFWINPNLDWILCFSLWRPFWTLILSSRAWVLSAGLPTDLIGVHGMSGECGNQVNSILSFQIYKPMPSSPVNRQYGWRILSESLLTSRDHLLHQFLPELSIFKRRTNQSMQSNFITIYMTTKLKSWLHHQKHYFWYNVLLFFILFISDIKSDLRTIIAHIHGSWSSLNPLATGSHAHIILSEEVKSGGKMPSPRLYTMSSPLWGEQPEVCTNDSGSKS